jgi:hypothetical protein
VDIDIVVRCLLFVAALPAAAKGIYELLVGSHIRRRDEYRFAKELFADMERVPPVHPFVLEKGFHALVNDPLIKIDEAQYLLTLKDSPRALRDFVMGRQYLDHLPHKGNLQIEFKTAFRGGWSRAWRRAIYLFSAFICWTLGAGPLIFSPELFSVLPEGTLLPLIVGCMLIFLPNAFFAMKAWARIYRAETLVKHQEKHTQRIVLEVVQGRRNVDGG